MEVIKLRPSKRITISEPKLSEDQLRHREALKWLAKNPEATKNAMDLEGGVRSPQGIYISVMPERTG